MEIPVIHKRFQRQKLAVLTAGWLTGPRVLLNGVPLKRAKGAYSARADDGSDLAVRLRVMFGDPVPTVRIGEDIVHLAKPLMWYEYAWAALPMLLLFIGGALGALAGILGSYCNFRIFRSDRGGAAKFALSGFTSCVAVVLFFALAIAFRLVIGR